MARMLHVPEGTGQVFVANISPEENPNEDIEGVLHWGSLTVYIAASRH